MNKHFLLICLLLCSLSNQLVAQKIIYRADKWGNTKFHKKWTTALDNPVLEKVVITQSDKAFKISFNNQRSLSYTIVSSKKLSPTSVEYYVKAGNQPHTIKVMYIGEKYFILCDKEWAVGEIVDMSSN